SNTTPLMGTHNNEKITQLLLQHKADARAQDWERITVLEHQLCARADPQILLLLIKAGATVLQPDGDFPPRRLYDRACSARRDALTGLYALHLSSYSFP